MTHNQVQDCTTEIIVQITNNVNLIFAEQVFVMEIFKMEIIAH